MTDMATFSQLGLFDRVPEPERAALSERLARLDVSRWMSVGELLRFCHADAESLNEAGIASAVGDCEALLVSRGVKLHLVRTPALGSKWMNDDVYVLLPDEGWAIVEDETHAFAREADPSVDSRGQQLDECVVRVGRTRFGLALGEGDDGWARVSRGFCALLRWLLGRATHGGAAARDSVYSLYPGANDHHVFMGSPQLAAALAAAGAKMALWPELDRTPTLHDFELTPDVIGESELADVRRLQADPPEDWDDYVQDSLMGRSMYADTVIYVAGSEPVDAATLRAVGVDVDADVVFAPRDESGRARGYLLVKPSSTAAARALVRSLHNREHAGNRLLAQAATLRQLRYLAKHFDLPASFDLAQV